MSASEKYSRIVWRQFCKNRLAVYALVFVIILVVTAIVAPLIANDRPILMYKDGKISMPILDNNNGKIENASWKIMAPIPFRPGSYDLDAILEAPSFKHILGTDGDGRDVAAQLIWGARVSISVGIVAVGIAVIIGVILGALAGFYGGWVDMIISRFIEVMICFPTFFLILAVLAFVGPSIYNIMVVIGVTGWTGVARLVRGECFKLRNRDFVKAAVVSGAGDRRIIFKHIIPSAMAPVLVSATFGIAAAILAESSLSFLGFGVPPVTPSWGNMLSQAEQFMDVAWWLTLAPGFAIFLTITAYNLVGEAIRDAIDPNLKT